ncbi:MAG: DUF1365 domain-containing protein [Alphaproteobacteria bacterium]|nr:DUF1365 domain-containing protein [Alphaproteobacteria bacterium]
MVIAPRIYNARVMHKRLFPKENSFHYGVYYLALPLPVTPMPGMLASFYAKDIGRRDGSDPEPWVRGLLADYDLNEKTKNIILITMPRVLGYVFNPVSFYLCLDEAKALRSVLCEVHNTFGEQHSYLCANPDHSPIKSDQWLESEKVFHVSPFLDRSGEYKFRFDLEDNRLGIWIDYYDASQHKQLITSLVGSLEQLTPDSLRRAFWRHPLVTLKSIILIHFQALKLVMKGIRYFVKPIQLPQKVTVSRNLNKM